MDLSPVIKAFNESNQPQITLLTTRDGRVVATLPRVRREIIVADSSFNKDVKVRASDVAWLCEEARLAAAPAWTLLAAALAALAEIDPPKAS